MLKQETIKTWLFDPELKLQGPEKAHDEKVNRLLGKVGDKIESIVNMVAGHCIVTAVVWKNGKK